MRQYTAGQRVEKKRQISAREYIELQETQKCPKKKNLKKLRQCFIYDSQYFLVETFLNIDDQPSLLRIETSKEHKELSIPSFLEIVREVTMDENYVGITMSNTDWKMPMSDKKAIKEGSPKKEVVKSTKESLKKW